MRGVNMGILTLAPRRASSRAIEAPRPRAEPDGAVSMVGDVMMLLARPLTCDNGDLSGQCLWW